MPDLRSAAFRTIPFTVHYKGTPFRFPPLPASEWIEAICDAAPAVLTLMETDSYDVFLDAIGDGSLVTSDLQGIANRAVAEAGGRPWWEVQRLIGSLLHPESGGRLLGAVLATGVQPERVTLAAFCAVIWFTVTKGADATELMKAESKLSVPPSGIDLDEIPEDDDFEAAARRMQNTPGMRIG